MTTTEMTQAGPTGLQLQEEGPDDSMPDDSFLPIDRLTEHGINAGDIKKAKEGGIHTINGLMMVTKKNLMAIKGLSDARVEKMLDAARKAVPKQNAFITANELCNKRKDIVKITTGVEELDAMLGGGVETSSITEVYGEFRCGKTQIAHTLCVTSMLPNKGFEGKVAYIDTEGTFRPERIRPIAERFNLDPDAVLENIVYARAHTHEQQHDLLVQVAAVMADNESPFRLLVVDSITALFRCDFQGRGELADRQQSLMKMMCNLIKIAEQFNVAVFITNQVISDPGGGAMFVSDPKKPAGGHVLAHCSTTRVSLRKGKGEQRVAKLIDSPDLPETEGSYCITEGGIANYKE